MAIQCKICGRPVEPTQRAMDERICGYCSGSMSEDVQECFDGSPCSEPPGDCKNCKWMGK